MAWRSSGTSNTTLIENLWRNKLITQPTAKAAFLKVDRAHYAPSPHTAYDDSPQPIGYGATISAPHMHANAVETLLPFLLPQTSKGGTVRPRRVLDIGSGSGYLTHVLAELVGETGVVVGLEHIPALMEMGVVNMGKSVEGRMLLEQGRVRFRVGDGRKGWVEEGSLGDAFPGVGGPAASTSASGSRDIKTGLDGNVEDEGGWDAIHVGAAAVELHEDLVTQLRSPGRLFIPIEAVGGGLQHIWIVDKDERGIVSKEKLYGVRYVPLTDAPKS